MELKMEVPKNWDQGIYGFVIWDVETKKAVKVFKRQPHLSRSECEKEFNNELHALQIASQAEGIKHLVPKLYGLCTVNRILNEKEEDISDRFYLDLSFEMEFIFGHFIKIGNLENAILFKIMKEFSLYGIMNVRDASVVLNEQREVLKIIDFSLEEIERLHS